MMGKTQHQVNVYNGSCACSLVVVVAVLWSSVGFGNCQNVNGVDAASPLLSPPGAADSARTTQQQLSYSKLLDSTRVLTDQINQHFGFCIINPEEDWNKSFNFSSNLEFVASCAARHADFSSRICSQAEVKIYFSSLFERVGNPSAIEFGKNCNLTSWNSGCEPGWACAVDGNAGNVQNSSDVPSRSSNCQPCCEGFFCPSGVACMIPCPLGSYCPLATLNSLTGACEPYTYQLPHGDSNHTCGGANIWADYGSSREMFCPAGSYCPTTVEKNNCSSGHYCRAGSTSQTRCLKLTTCDDKDGTESFHLYGVILIVVLSFLLIVFYSCSDKFLAIQKRKVAKSRERAANFAREKARARENWKAAKIAARRYASGIQNQISRTFSRRINIEESDKISKLAEESRAQIDGELYPPVDPNTETPSEQTSATSEKIKNCAPKERRSNQTMIFKNTYEQLEREKALQEENKNLTFSGLISLVAGEGIKRRHPIKIEFKNLTLTLKGKKKHLLKCVTGKIMPGRITAVMGQSGSGKTTFLTALLGKNFGCTISGSILINEKHESIHAYRKIIGFVPQDDIVHGNLTVEENLWFSANCRLPAKMERVDKVLIVERVIEYLGLHTIRDSLVGTVEKRGISGGQRKRVNVGLEMVIEPSLLILDEPTSGLDSSTSQLLLRALKREALKGVNICMVIHQPSYALFNMFDDLVLLAKGGFTAYHGPVMEAEKYFTGLGFAVPERINPPDHFINVLEGVVKQSENFGVSYKELPVRWMLHNGYPVPHDLLQSVSELTMSSTPATPSLRTGHGVEMAEHSFVGEMWQDMESNVVEEQDKIIHNSTRTEDISKRTTPWTLQQYKYFIGRVGKQRLREAGVQGMDYLILCLAGTCIGILSGAKDETFGAFGYTYTVIAIPLLCQMAALRTFSLDKLQYWRESASGISSLAYFLAKDTVDHFNTVVKPLLYLSMFYFFTNPRSSFTENYIIMLCLVYCVTGIAYVLSIFLHPGSAQLCSVLLPVVMTLIVTRPRQSGILKMVSNLCYPKWALEAFMIANAKRYYGVWLITRCGALEKNGYNLHDWNLCLMILVLIGVGTRILAFIGMLASNKR